MQNIQPTARSSRFRGVEIRKNYWPAGGFAAGVRVNFSPERGNGWCLLRMSLHEPLMPLNIESDDVGGVDKIANELYPVLKGFDKLDTEKLRG